MSAEAKAKAGDRSFGQVVWDDVEHVFTEGRRGEFHRTLRRDLYDLYHFYLDEETRGRLERMSRLKQFFYSAWWLLRNAILRVSRVRRLLVVLALLLFVMGRVGFSGGRVNMAVEFTPLAFVILFVVLMLELKDKLLARDELRVGRAVQLALLPNRNPTLSGWDIWLFTRPANDVGGDLVDYLELHDGRLDVMLADVSGKGLGAALLMAKLQATIRALAARVSSLNELGSQANTILCRDGISGRFATLLYGVIEAGSSSVRILNAGHLPPLLITGQASPETLPPVAMPLGVDGEAAFEEQMVTMEAGDLLIAYSDGLSDARNGAGEFFGDRELPALFESLRGLDAETAGRRVLETVERFVGDEPLNDDLSIALIRRVGSASRT